jgi:hypothetical protein
VVSDVVYCESIKRELKRRLIYEYRCDERLKTKNEESTRLADTGLVVELECLKTKTRLIDEKFASVRVSAVVFLFFFAQSARADDVPDGKDRRSKPAQEADTNTAK